MNAEKGDERMTGWQIPADLRHLLEAAPSWMIPESREALVDIALGQIWHSINTAANNKNGGVGG